MKSLSLSIISLLAVTALSAQTPGAPGNVKFQLVKSPVTTASSTGNPANQFYHATYSGAAWGDPDGDGRMDLVYSDRNSHVNSQTVQISYYINNGDGTMRRAAGHGLDPAAFSCPIWFDYNNDGHLDLLMPGLSNHNHQWRDGDTKLEEVVAHLYKNTGAENGQAKFEEVANHGIRPLYNGLQGGKGHNWVASGDFDKDGWTDLLMAGFDENARIESEHPEEAVRALYLYRNINGERFEMVANPLNGNAPFNGMTDGSVMLEDLDGDGWLDIMATGYGHTRTSESYVYWNNGDGTFSAHTEKLRGIANGSCYVRDLNNDQLPELVFGGIYMNTNGKNFFFYQNLGNRKFQILDIEKYEGYDGTQMAFGDVNQDGLVDILLGGHGASHEHTTVVYVNQGDFNFTATGAHYADVFGKLGHFSRITHGAHHMVDVNADGFLDVWMSGWCNGGCGQGCLTEMYLNNSASKGVVANVAPAVPTNLYVDYDKAAGRATFTWDAATDDNTPAAGLRYNFYIKAKDSDKLFEVVPADLTTGYVKVGTIQNAINKCSYTTSIPAAGDYEWGVQTIDNANTGSLFATANFTAGIESVETTPLRLWGTFGAIGYGCNDEATLTVYNLSGIAIASASVAGAGSLELPAGLYIATLSTADSSVTAKVSVK